MGDGGLISLLNKSYDEYVEISKKGSLYKRLRPVFVNVLTSGKSATVENEAEVDRLLRYTILNFLIIFGGFLLCFFAVKNLYAGLPRQAAVLFAVTGFVLVTMILLRTGIPFIIPALFSVVPFLAACLFFAKTGGEQGSGILWIFSFPLIAVFVLGLKTGSILSATLGSLLALFFFFPGLSVSVYAFPFKLRSLGLYALVFALSVVFELTKKAKDRWVARLNKALRAERNEIVIMKDNLKSGVFMLDSQWIIQPYYSKALSSILELAEPAGKNLLTLFSRSLKPKDIDTLSDYLSMVLDRSFDLKMLEDINPVYSFEYTAETGTKKTLQTTFSPIEREDGTVHLLCTFEDHTRETELEKRLSEEEKIRQDEMKALYEVVHMDPASLNDFISDTDAEFECMNAVLKDKKTPAASALAQMYQSIHAIKSNALLIGLDSLAAKLHTLEDTVRSYRDREGITPGDVLRVMIELDFILNITDNLRTLVEKIQAFTHGDIKQRAGDMLRQSLEQTVAKTAAEQGKKIRFEAQNLELAGVSPRFRRDIKDILVQLARNAVYHGIETPQRRTALGKDECGLIRLTAEIADGKMTLKLSDDGGGIDFSTIRERARQLHISETSLLTENKTAVASLLLKPGFSTADTADLYAGRGVGLSLVRDRVRNAGGAIRLQTAKNTGTTFIIQLQIPGDDV